MSTFDSTKTKLADLLADVVSGKVQLPDFQRGWVWDDEHIRSLLVSIARSFPIGAVMLLETGGEARFQARLAEGVVTSVHRDPEKLILDGQQRLTSLTQVLKLLAPTSTRDEKHDIKRFYYFDIDRALNGPDVLADALVGVDEKRQLRANFGRDVVLDLSSPEREINAFHFPCNQILSSDDWEEHLNAQEPARFSRYMAFRKEILNPFRTYLLPVIVLSRDTSKAAVCLIFEKVNTGGVPLSVFDLVTATYAADNFNLRNDWFGAPKKSSPGVEPQAELDGSRGRRAILAAKPLLKELEPTDFLQGVTLLHTLDRKQADLSAGKTGKDVTAVSAKREHILATPLSAYEHWADRLSTGILEAEQFLRHLGFYHTRFLPYAAQIVPLATVLTHLKERWLEPQVQRKLSRWYWCGVFGELYGSATETRIALDLQELLTWIDEDGAPEPSTVTAAGFQPSRLDTLRTRTSAAYRGLYVLLQQQGAQDFFWKARILDIDRNERGIDIHHIFPRKWCEGRRISPRIYNSIVNKTAISLKANRKIGGNAPSKYLEQLQNDKAVQLDAAAMDVILRSHSIDPTFLRADDFEGFYSARRAALLSLVEAAMNKKAIYGNEEVPQDADDEDVEEAAGDLVGSVDA
jgi:hypothetical protein